MLNIAIIRWSKKKQMSVENGVHKIMEYSVMCIF